MSGATTGAGGAGGGSAAAIMVAQGHAISMHRVRERLAAFDALSMPWVLAAVKRSQAGAECGGAISRDSFRSGRRFDRYVAAQVEKDWDESDRLFLDALKPDSAKYGRILGAEETARAFSAWLCGTALALDYVYRWIDPPEMGSCAGGTFESKIEADGTRRGFKALTTNPMLVFEERKIQMRVPMGDTVRGDIRCVRYTALPRRIGEKDERIGDPKSVEHAAEAEIRVPDGTPIPPRTHFAVLPGARIDSEVAMALGARYRITWRGE